jgi:maltooligosyltrehalose synthase
MPVAESPSYHGYDVTNYYRVQPDYGTNKDFKRRVVGGTGDSRGFAISRHSPQGGGAALEGCP